jgi:hypothetical protein
MEIDEEKFGEFIKNYLRENMKIKIHTDGDIDMHTVTVSIDGEEICSDYFTTNN